MFIYYRSIILLRKMSYKKITKEMYECTCERCDHTWTAEKLPNACARCKSTAWNKPKLNQEKE